jgi:hypothetical protein
MSGDPPTDDGADGGIDADEAADSGSVVEREASGVAVAKRLVDGDDGRSVQFHLRTTADGARSVRLVDPLASGAGAEGVRFDPEFAGGWARGDDAVEFRTVLGPGDEVLTGYEPPADADLDAFGVPFRLDVSDLSSGGSGSLLDRLSSFLSGGSTGDGGDGGPADDGPTDGEGAVPPSPDAAGDPGAGAGAAEPAREATTGTTADVDAGDGGAVGSDDAGDAAGRVGAVGTDDAGDGARVDPRRPGGDVEPAVRPGSAAVERVTEDRVEPRATVGGREPAIRSRPRVGPGAIRRRDGRDADLLAEADDDALPRSSGVAAVPDSLADAETVGAALAAEIEAGRLDVDTVSALAAATRGRLEGPAEARVARLERQVDELAAYTEAIESFLVDPGTADAVRSDLEGLRADVATLGDRLDATDEDVANLREAAAAIDDRVDDLAAGVESLATVRGDVAALRSQLGAIEAADAGAGGGDDANGDEGDADPDADAAD